MRRTYLSAALVLATLLSVARPADAGTALDALVEVGREVVAESPERFGANVDLGEFYAWDMNATALNNWTADPGFEPIVLRYKGTATGGDARSIVNDEVETTSVWDTIGDGFFDGAEVRVYRAGDGAVRLVRTARVARYLASPASGYRIQLDADGPAVERGDVYVLSMQPTEAPMDRIHPRMDFIRQYDSWRPYGLYGDASFVELTRDPSTRAPENGGLTSMRITLTAADEGGVAQYNTGYPGDRVFAAYEPGRTYRVDLWMRHESPSGGAATVRIGPYPEPIEATFPVTGSWARYSFDFRGPQPLPADSGVASVSVTFQGPGTLWVDNLRVYDAALAPYALRPEVREALDDFRPGTLRIWSGQTNTAWGTTLDNWIAPEGQGLRYWYTDSGRSAGRRFNLPTALETCREVDTRPWLIVHPSFDEAEWRNLIEYLAGPASSPYGARRAASGREAPWTDAFDRIRIELGNETWNSLFAPWTYAGGTEYGRFAEYFYSIAKSSPHFAAVEGRIEFVLGGFILQTDEYGHGQAARLESPSSSYVGVAPYLGGWDGIQLPASSDRDVYRNALLYTPWVTKVLTDRHVATRDALRAQGVDYELALYEGGPGYGLPSSGEPYDPTQEAYGKSLAAGVTTLDTFLYNSSRGFGPQCFFTFQAGQNWASHTAFTHGFRPHTAWLALQMRNRYCEGDMVETRVLSGPTADLAALPDIGIPEQTGVPYVGAYAFHANGRYSVVLLSRHLTETIQVRVKLPEKVRRRATLYTLTGDPRATNVDAMNVRIVERPISNANQLSISLPPGSVYVISARTRGVQ